MGQGKYKNNDPRPVHKKDGTVTKVIVIIQETEPSYLIYEVKISGTPEGLKLDYSDKKWKRKNTYNLGGKIGDVGMSGWSNTVNEKDMKSLIQKYYNSVLSEMEKAGESVNNKREKSGDSKDSCPNCGCSENQIRTDGIFKCKNCNLYYNPI